MIMSRKIRSGLSVLALSSASWPLEAVRTIQPASATMLWICVRSVGESSTTRTLLMRIARLLLRYKHHLIAEQFGQVLLDHALKALARHRLSQIGVAACQLAADMVEHRAFPGEHDDRGMFPQFVLFDGFADPVTIDTGEEYVQKDQVVGGAACEEFTRPLPALGEIRHNTQELQLQLDLLAHRWTVIHHHSLVLPRCRRGRRRRLIGDLIQC